MKLIELRELVVQELESVKHQYTISGRPQAKVDLLLIYYLMYLDNNFVADDDTYLDWDSTFPRLQEIAKNATCSYDLSEKIAREFSFLIPLIPMELRGPRLYPTTLTLPKQALLNQYRDLVADYQARRADDASLEHQTPDILDAAIPLNINHTYLLYCILATDKYRVAARTHVSRGFYLSTFVSTIDDNCNASQVVGLEHSVFNHNLWWLINNFLARVDIEDHFVVAECSAASNNHHLITIKMNRIPATVPDAPDTIAITILDPEATASNAGSLVHIASDKDECQASVIRALIRSIDPNLQLEFTHEPVAPQQAANLLIEAVNQRLASDLQLIYQPLTDFDIQNARWKLNHAVRGLEDFPFDRIYTPPAPDYSFYLTCIAGIAICAGGGMLVVGILTAQPVVAITGLGVAVGGALVYGLFAYREQAPSPEDNNEQLVPDRV